VTGGTPTCKTTCVSAGDCATGASCNSTTHQCTSEGPTCKDAFTVVDASGTETSCSPYKCQNGACAATCQTSDDCADTAACAGGHCQTKVTGDAGPDDAGSGGSGTGGSGSGNTGTHIVVTKGCCTVAPGSESDDRQGPIVIVLALVGLARRHRKESR
jgi:hypothetical protein